jgi:hypothetical protein
MKKNLNDSEYKKYLYSKYKVSLSMSDYKHEYDGKKYENLDELLVILDKEEMSKKIGMSKLKIATIFAITASILFISYNIYSKNKLEKVRKYNESFSIKSTDTTFAGATIGGKIKDFYAKEEDLHIDGGPYHFTKDHLMLSYYGEDTEPDYEKRGLTKPISAITAECNGSVFGDSKGLPRIEDKSCHTDALTLLNNTHDWAKFCIQSKYSTDPYSSVVLKKNNATITVSFKENKTPYVSNLGISSQESLQYLNNSYERCNDSRNELHKNLAEKINYANKFPYYAKITCSLHNRHYGIINCMGGHGRFGRDTDLKIKNNGAQRIFKLYELSGAGREMQDGFTIDLTEEFSISIQNSSDGMVLGLKIFDRMTNNVLFEELVSDRYDSINVKN